MSLIRLSEPRTPQEQALAELVRVPPLADEFGGLLVAAGFRAYLVGGSVRDALLGREHPEADIDVTTDARPDDVLAVARGWADAVWDAGIGFGTVGLQRRGTRLEVTTFRTERYDADSRNPEVAYGDSLEGDLVRRDFTVNAMAVSLPDHVFSDPHGGLVDLAAGRLRTPGRAEDSFTDDPLRMMRAARFVAQLGFTPAQEVLAAMRDLAPRLAIVSPERVRDEFIKTMLAPDPVAGLELMVDTGLAAEFLPELPRMSLEIDEHHQHKDVYRHTLTVLRNAMAREDGPDLELRLAALLHDIGKPATRAFSPGGRVSFHHHEVVGARMTRNRMKALRFPKQVTTDVARLVELHLRFHGYGEAQWTDSAVRRYVTDAGPLLDRLNKLVRSDCTTRNRRKAAALEAAYDELERRIASLRAQEELDAIRPDLDGNDVQRLLGVPPGPVVGRALRHLLDLRFAEGPLGREAAEAELLRWAREQGIAGAG